MCGLVHVDNVVTGIHLAIEKLELISGTSVYPSFDLTTSYENMGLLLISAAKEMGFRGIRYKAQQTLTRCLVKRLQRKCEGLLVILFSQACRTLGSIPSYPKHSPPIAAVTLSNTFAVETTAAKGRISCRNHHMALELHPCSAD
jgi:hypothetical protein